MSSNLFGAKTYSQVLESGLTYIEDRMKGKITSFVLPWKGLNKCGINGIEWGSFVTVGARPGSGKTMLVSQILKEAKMLNPTQDFSMLEFQFEMGDNQYAARQYAAEVAADYNMILSANHPLDQVTLKLLKAHLAGIKALELNNNLHRMLIKTPLSHVDMEAAIRYYFEKMGNRPMIVTIDHSWLMKKAHDEKEKIQTLYNTAEMIVRVKNDLPVIVIMITQMGRGVEEVSRIIPGSIANYPTGNDVFGGDALMQNSDMVFVLNRPYKYNLNLYGPKKYIVQSDDIFLHILKSRNSADDTNLLFLKADFKNQRLLESPDEPPTSSTAQYVPYSKRTVPPSP